MMDKNLIEWFKKNIIQNRIIGNQLFERYLTEKCKINIPKLKQDFIKHLQTLKDLEEIQSYELEDSFRNILLVMENLNSNKLEFIDDKRGKKISAKALAKTQEYDLVIGRFDASRANLFFQQSADRLDKMLENMDNLFEKLTQEFESAPEGKYRLSIAHTLKEIFDKELKHQGGMLERLYKQMEIVQIVNNLLKAWRNTFDEMEDIFQRCLCDNCIEQIRETRFVQIFDEKLKSLVSETVEVIDKTAKN